MSQIQYTKDHEWVRTEGDLTTIGITDFAQAQLGDVVFVELPGVGRTFAAGESLGEVVEVNDEVAGDPSLVNSGAESDGWLVKLRFSEQPELLDEAAYRELTA